MTSASFHVTAHSAAPPERVYAILADGPNWPRWAGPLIGRGEWEREGSPTKEGVGAIRKIGRAPLFAREEIVVHDPPRHHAYTILSGQPVRNYRADVRLTDNERGGTLITWTAEFDPTIPGTGALLELWFRRIIGATARRLARAAEAEESETKN